jgi:methionyl-tRNA formyltransferase
MGTPGAAVPTLDRLLTDRHVVAAVYTQPDRPAGRGQKLSISPIKQLALDHKLDIRQPVKIKTEEALAEFVSLGADLAIVAAYGRILPASFLTAFPRGCINVHFSVLPKYRGAAPVNWAIVNGEVETGVTTMQMDAGLDTGDILLQEETTIGPEETSIELMDRLSVSGAELLSRTLREIDSIELRPQDHSAATHAPIMRREDGRIDWSMSGRDISNRVRGFQPFPTAYTTWDQKRLTLWKATAGEGGGEPGEVLEVSRDRISVACGAGERLEISELQLEGKRRMSAAEFVNGAQLTVGQRLG